MKTRALRLWPPDAKAMLRRESVISSYLLGL
jgi:hypothetical protein